MNVKLTTQDKALLLSVKEMIDNDSKNHLTIQQIARKFHINDYKLRHGFKQLYGITIYNYYSQKKLEYALELLKDPDLTMQQVAARAGYKNITTFNRRFRRKYQMTPTAWKKEPGSSF